MGRKRKNKKLEGIFRANEKGFGFIELEDEDAEDIFVPSNSVNGALNGDKVQFVIFKKKEGTKKAEGKIVKIVKRERESLVGIFQKSKNFGFVVPDDKKFGTDIFISKKYCKEAKNNDKVIVKILRYPEKGKNAEGEIIEILGGVNQAGIDMLSVIKEFDLPNEFPEFVKEEAKNMAEWLVKILV